MNLKNKTRVKIIFPITLLLILLLSANTLVFSQHIQKKPDAASKDVYVIQLLDSAAIYSKIDIKVAYSYIEKALSNTDQLEDSTKAIMYSKAGETCFNLSLYDMALDYFFKSQDLIDKSDQPKRCKVYNSIANVYLTIEDYKQAREYYLKAKRIIELNLSSFLNQNKLITTVYNNIAVLERKEKKYAKAEQLLLANLKRSISNKDTFNIISSYLNLANVYTDMKNTKDFFHYSELALILSKKINSKRDLALVLVNRGLYYFEDEQKNDLALEAAKEAYKIADDMNLARIKKEASLLLYNVFKSTGNFKEALYYKEIEQELSEEAINAEYIKNMAAIEFKVMHEKKIVALNKAQLKKQLIFYIVFSCILFISMVLYFMLQTQRSRSEKRKMQIELLNEKFELKNKELTSKALQILQITEILDKTYRSVAKVRETAPLENKKELTAIINDLKIDRNSLNWSEFEKLFVETSEEFYKKIKKDYSDLTKNESRLCAFMKMNLSTKEISAITNQSERSIIMARSRLRKKLKIDNTKDTINSILLKY